MISRKTTSIIGVMLAPTLLRSLDEGTSKSLLRLTMVVSRHLPIHRTQFDIDQASRHFSRPNAVPHHRRDGLGWRFHRGRAGSALTSVPNKYNPLNATQKSSLTFLKNFLRHPTQVGAVAPSSPRLAEAMVEWFDWESIRNVVEFGPGTGVFTEAIVDRLHADAKFFAIERSAELIEITQARCPGVRVYEDSVVNVAELCRREGMASVDGILCGLPWASFSDSLQAEIFAAMLEVLPPGAKFATFAYWQGVVLPAGRRFYRRLQDTFTTVERSRTVWRNLPPAFVYRCVR